MVALNKSPASMGVCVVDAVTASQTGASLAAVPLPASNGIDTQSWQDHFESVLFSGTAVVDLTTASTALSFVLTIKASASSNMSSATTLYTSDTVEVDADGTISLWGSLDLALFNDASGYRYFNATLTPSDTGGTAADADETVVIDLVAVACEARNGEARGNGYIVI
jgi:hypothetical protein